MTYAHTHIHTYKSIFVLQPLWNVRTKSLDEFWFIRKKLNKFWLTIAYLPVLSTNVPSPQIWSGGSDYKCSRSTNGGQIRIGLLVDRKGHLFSSGAALKNHSSTQVTTWWLQRIWKTPLYLHEGSLKTASGKIHAVCGSTGNHQRERTTCSNSGWRLRLW